MVPDDFGLRASTLVCRARTPHMQGHVLTLRYHSLVDLFLALERLAVGHGEGR